ncbi:hypothetical protein NEOLEDRAFT_1181560 [Neolentinus lepideus HHB14362 ss-1]|uniref:Uncharacterized protein n=1 Tax=Neolentinus lepideus HHB14362 ss-1 TaxID=1314782 RepID=A0A165PV75_9AGAM|nr:hypothetical protein NEOLEDRAFT_1181560 [Neolentinus lepideus HHB14362 ss-1]
MPNMGTSGAPPRNHMRAREHDPNPEFQHTPPSAAGEHPKALPDTQHSPNPRGSMLTKSYDGRPLGARQQQITYDDPTSSPKAFRHPNGSTSTSPVTAVMGFGPHKAICGPSNRHSRHFGPHMGSYSTQRHFGPSNGQSRHFGPRAGNSR